MNLLMSRFETELVDLINGYNIPIVAKRAILEAVLAKVSFEADKVLLAEINAVNAKNEEKPETIKEEGKLNAESTRCEL